MTDKIQSAKYEVEEKDWGFAVLRREPAEVRITTASEAGVTSGVVPASELFPGYTGMQVVFAAAYQRDLAWDVDINCGMQRWHGTKTQREVRAALRRCGFKESQIKGIVTRARAKQGKYAPRY